MLTKAMGRAEELAVLWKQARIAAIGNSLKSDARGKPELDLIDAVKPDEQPRVLAAIRAASENVGKQIATTLDGPLSLAELVHLLSHSQVYCFAGSWKSCDGGASQCRQRKSCPYVHGSFDCDYWREAAKGLVAGLSENVAYSRHDSLGHGDKACIDYVYYSPAVSRELGEVPAPITKALAPFIRELGASGIGLHLEGYKEGMLFYKLEGSHIQRCEKCRGLIVTELVRQVRQTDYPLQKIVDMTGTESGEAIREIG